MRSGALTLSISLTLNLCFEFGNLSFSTAFMHLFLAGFAVPWLDLFILSSFIVEWIHLYIYEYPQRKTANIYLNDFDTTQYLQLSFEQINKTQFVRRRTPNMVRAHEMFSTLFSSNNIRKLFISLIDLDGDGRFWKCIQISNKYHFHATGIFQNAQTHTHISNHLEKMKWQLAQLSSACLVGIA